MQEEKVRLPRDAGLLLAGLGGLWYLTFNQRVMGSSPIALTNRINGISAVFGSNDSQAADLGSVWASLAMCL